MKRYVIPARLLLPLGLGALATLALVALLWRLSGPPVARADPGARYVAPAGLDAGNDCSDSSHPCATIQHAVDAAIPGDVVKIATGVYSDVHDRPVPPGYPHPPANGLITQVVYLSKSLTLRGGYTVTFTDPPDPGANPTTLDAGGEGRVLLIAAPATSSALASRAETPTGQAISITLEGLRISAGDADGLGGGDDAGTAGGGLYVISTTVMISDCHLFGNAAAYGGGLYVVTATVTISDCHLSGNDAGHGGGLYLYASTATLLGNTVSANTAGDGGGLYLYRAAAMLSGNTVLGNTAYHYGGGLYLDESPTTLIANTVSENHTQSFGYGGGLYLSSSPATLTDNTISFNDTGFDGRGAGLYLIDSAVTLSANIISHNRADDGLGGGLCLYDSAATLNDNLILHNRVGWGAGGGVALSASDDVTLIGNTVSDNGGYSGGGLYLGYSAVTLISNTVSGNGGYSGGGLYLYDSAATLIANTVVDNWVEDRGSGLYLYASPATLIANTIASNTDPFGGSCGLFLWRSDATLINNAVVDNRVDGAGCGIHIAGSSPRLLHTTIARSGSHNGIGIYVTDDAGIYSAVALTNTILVSQAVGINVRAGNTATLAGTLWGGGAWANAVDWAGAGTILTGTINLWGDPGFLDPDSGDYHIGFGSAAIDAGLDAGVTTDIDGEPRPAALGFDIGADENPGVILRLHKTVEPRLLNPGQTLTYILVVTSDGTEAATNVWLTDTLPALQQALAIATSRGSCALGGGVAASNESNGWGGTTICDLGALAPGESASVTLTAQVTATAPARLPVLMRNTAWVRATETSRAAYVDTTLHDCHARLNDDPAEYSTVQAAVDASTRPGDLVKVAGYCTGVTHRAGVAQVVYLSKTLTLQGGWNTALTERDVVRYPTTLDAWGQGRVLYIADPATGSALASGAERRTGQAISPTVEGLRITGGDASGLGGGAWGGDAGGGLCVIGATARISDNLIFSNTADGYGGGLYLYDSPATLSGNSVFTNTATYGAGLSLSGSPAVLTGNTVSFNIASRSSRGNGGGLYLDRSPAVLSANTISANTARDSGGGLFLDDSDDAMLSGNTVSANIADDNGGGLFLYHSSGATLNDNTVSANIADDNGGGLYLLYSSGATLNDNTVFANIANDRGGGLYYSSSNAATLSGNTVSANHAHYGGGLYLNYSAATLSANTVSANHAQEECGGLYLLGGDATLSGNTISANTADYGGGLCLSFSTATLANTIVTDNRAVTAGSGVYIRGTSPRLLHTTLARNRGGDGSGIYVTNSSGTYSTVALNNTILVSQALGIYVTAGNTARLEGTLWGDGAWANGSDWGGAGTILPGTVNLWGDPDFLDPDHGDYHIGPASAAIDAGVDAGVSIDIDGEPRPWGTGYDIGADECHCNQVPYLPSHPTPAHGATGVPLTQTLSWRGGDPDGDPVTYAIAFGTDDPPPLVATTPLTSYTPALVAATTYYWTVSASDGVSLSLGPLWRFTTRHTLYLPLLFHRLP